MRDGGSAESGELVKHLKRPLFILAVAISLVLCLATVALWQRYGPTRPTPSALTPEDELLLESEVARVDSVAITGRTVLSTVDAALAAESSKLTAEKFRARADQLMQTATLLQIAAEREVAIARRRLGKETVARIEQLAEQGGETPDKRNLELVRSLYQQEVMPVAEAQVTDEAMQIFFTAHRREFAGVDADGRGLENPSIRAKVVSQLTREQFSRQREKLMAEWGRDVVHEVDASAITKLVDLAVRKYRSFPTQSSTMQ